MASVTDEPIEGHGFFLSFLFSFLLENLLISYYKQFILKLIGIQNLLYQETLIITVKFLQKKQPGNSLKNYHKKKNLNWLPLM